MQQVVLLEPGRFALRTVDPPQPGEGQALVRVRRIGVCGTDLHAYAGRQPMFSYPRVLGHELAVTVETVPAGEPRALIGPQESLPGLHHRLLRRLLGYDEAVVLLLGEA